jgi:hypothetical protein
MPIYFSLSALQRKRHVVVLAFERMLINVRTMPERTQKPTGPAPWERKQGDGDGPKSPDVQKPDTRSILERMRKVDPDQARRYRQRTGQ